MKVEENIISKTKDDRIRIVDSWKDYVSKMILMYLSKERIAAFREIESFFVRYILDERELYGKIENLSEIGLIQIFSGENYENGTTILKCTDIGIEIGQYYEREELKTNYEILNSFILDTLNKRLEHLGHSPSLNLTDLDDLPLPITT